ncbi:AhpC/TSA family protein [Pedobacter steynii]|uniref:AhpC/TSA family protein n=2 Tax=Pedobacter steynii TaxID=430522 RepID=A0A1H0GNN0_9SPHI|nr:AhpC/TSA family protein [Pedobacter steynii]
MLLLAISVNGQLKTISWKKMSGITLLNNAGKTETISQTRVIVLVFLSPECPLCRNYIQVLNTLQKKHTEVQIFGIFPGTAYTAKQINDFQKEYKVSFNLLIDRKKELTHYLKATTTPESILISKLGAIPYRGLIDNWASGLGQKRKVTTEKFLENAIEDVLNQRIPATSQTKPIGCLINDI